MSHWEFRTEAFRDPAAVRERNVNGIEGAALAEAVRGHLRGAGYECWEVFPEDFGWVFYATGPDGRYFCAFSLEPWGDGEECEAARVMVGHASLDRQRSLMDRILRRNCAASGGTVPMAVLAFLRAHPAVADLREG